MRSKIHSLILIILCITIASCSSDDEGNVTLTAEGRWLVSSLLVESSFDFNADGTASRDLFQETSCYNGNYIEFFEEGEVDIVVDFAYIYVDEDNNQQDVECENGFGLSSTFTQNGNTITVVNDFDESNLIGTISGNTLTVTVANGFEIEVYNPVTDDIDIVSEDFTIVFTKS